MAQQAQQESSQKKERRLVIPGDLLAEAYKGRPGPNTYMRDGSLFASVLGLAEQRRGDWGVIPIGGTYLPRAGDLVISVITEVGPSNWMTDINAPYPAPMHASETPWRVEFGETGAFLRAGDTVLAKILFVDETRKVQITMKESNLRKLEGGHLIEIDPSKVARVIGRKGSMVDLIKSYTDVWLVVGQNGRVWMNGELDGIAVATDTIRLIEQEAHRPGLTARVTDFLKTRTGRTVEPAADQGDDDEGDNEEDA